MSYSSRFSGVQHVDYRQWWWVWCALQVNRLLKKHFKTRFSKEHVSQTVVQLSSEVYFFPGYFKTSTEGWCGWCTLHMYTVSQKNPPWGLVAIFPKRMGIFQPNFTRLLCVPIYARLRIFIQLPATLTKLCHISVTTIMWMSTIDRNACWVVALNMA